MTKQLFLRERQIMGHRIQGYLQKDAVKLARYYFETGEAIYNEVTEEAMDRDPDLLYKSIVGYVNSAFACEIMLKVQALNNNVALDRLTRTHTITELFESLPASLQELIKKKTIAKLKSRTALPYNESLFHEDLVESGNAFVDARYWYEIGAPGSKGKTARQLFIYSLSFALRSLPVASASVSVQIVAD